MALTTIGNTAFGTSSVVSAAIKDNAVVYNKLDANTAHLDRSLEYTAGQFGRIATIGVKTSGSAGSAANTVSLALSNANYYSVTTNANITFNNPSSINPGQSGAIFLTSNGSFTVSWGSYWRFAGGTVPTMSTTAGKVDRVDYVVQSSNTIHVVATIDLLGTA